jgi:hypothetical protein
MSNWSLIEINVLNDLHNIMACSYLEAELWISDGVIAWLCNRVATWSKEVEVIACSSGHLPEAIHVLSQSPQLPSITSPVFLSTAVAHQGLPFSEFFRVHVLKTSPEYVNGNTQSTTKFRFILINYHIYNL